MNSCPAPTCELTAQVPRSRAPKQYHLLGIALVATSACLPLFLILKYGVNVPYCDEWGLANLLSAVRAGQSSLEMFWAPHNEHRILFPKIAFLILIIVTGWNSVSMMVASWGVIAGTAVFLFQGFTRVYNDTRRGYWLITVALSFLLFFSPIQRQNWLWSFQLTFFF